MRLIDAEPIINNLSAMKTQLGYDAIYIDGMIKALREEEEVEATKTPNDPLTISELREMGKEPEPIYIPGLGWRICWGIEDSSGRLALKVGVTARIYLENYGKGFVAYRRKPEEGGNMKPILFNTEMVRAILEDRKTATRRVVKPQPEKYAHSPYECVGGRFAFRIGENGCTEQYKPPYRPSDILYVRETWAYPSGIEIKNGAGPQMYLYKADVFQPAAWDKWRPSIHMPRKAARIFLRVTDVRVERLQEMQPYDIAFEGFRRQRDFIALWDSTIKPADRALYGWEANPWVWVIEFERCEKPNGGQT